MAQLTAYSDLYPLLYRELPGTHGQAGVLLAALQQAARDFCIETEAWRDVLDPIAIQSYQKDYTLSSNYSAQVHRVLQVATNSVTVDPVHYLLYEEDKLRFDDAAVPANLDNRLLRCANTGTTVFATWNAITDASFGYTFGGEDYTCTDVDLSESWIEDFDDVALQIQTAIRAGMESNYANCRAYYNTSGTLTHFKFWLQSGIISYLTADATGTDISGASYLNGLTGSATLSAKLDVEVVFRPHMAAEALPDWFADKWAEALVAGAGFRLASEPRGPYANAAIATKLYERYMDAVNKAKIENDYEQKNDAETIGA